MSREKQNREIETAARLLVRPKHLTGRANLGLQPLGLDGKRDGLLYVPANYHVDRPAPLVLMLHGAGSNARQGLAPFLQLADEFGLILLAPDSRSQTWDIILGEYGSDIAFIDTALEQVFNCYAVDPARIAVEGFSDGASYALSIGITNGDLFTHVIRFSPGFIAPAKARDTPRLFISHGKWDNVLPIDRCSRKIGPQLQRAGYDILYREFNGFHTIPSNLIRESIEWFAGKR